MSSNLVAKISKSFAGWTSHFFLIFFWFVLCKHYNFSCILFGETEPFLWKYRPRSTFCPGDLSDLIPEKKLKNRDLEISENPNIDEFDRIYVTSPRGLRWGKTEPADYILMFCSANAPGITYKFIWGLVVLRFGENIFESSTKSIISSWALCWN